MANTTQVESLYVNILGRQAGQWAPDAIAAWVNSGMSVPEIAPRLRTSPEGIRITGGTRTDGGAAGGGLGLADGGAQPIPQTAVWVSPTTTARPLGMSPSRTPLSAPSVAPSAVCRHGERAASFRPG